MPTLEREIGSLEAAMGDPDFWNNQEKARAANTGVANLKKKLGAFQKLNGRYDDMLAGIELAKEFDDHEAAVDAYNQSAELDKDIKSFELLTLLDRPNDSSSCYLVIQAGAGVSLLPRYVEVLMPPNLRAVAVTRPTLEYPVMALRLAKHPLSPAAMAFLDIARQHLKPPRTGRS